MSAPSLPTPSRRLVMLLRIMFQRAGSLSVTWNSARLRGAVVACARTAAGKATASNAAAALAAKVRLDENDMAAPGQGRECGDGESALRAASRRSFRRV